MNDGDNAVAVGRGNDQSREENRKENGMTVVDNEECASAEETTRSGSAIDEEDKYDDDEEKDSDGNDDDDNEDSDSAANDEDDDGEEVEEYEEGTESDEREDEEAAGVKEDTTEGAIDEDNDEDGYENSKKELNELKSISAENDKKMMKTSRKKATRRKVFIEEENNDDDSTNKERHEAKAGETSQKTAKTLIKEEKNKKRPEKVVLDEGQNEDNGNTKEDQNLAEEDAASKQKVKTSTTGIQKVKQREPERVTSKVEDVPGSSGKEELKKSKTKGMIFICNSKTKMDCFRYKVLGLPANKRDIVGKVYKGMRLFLFDVDHKLLYGIYKAAVQGGYNIEPKAFGSAFPAQVRFKVTGDYLPVAEEKFRKAIKANYYTRNKFDCELTFEQVKKLCKLFVPASRGIKSKDGGRGPRGRIQDQNRQPGVTFKRGRRPSRVDEEAVASRRHGRIRRRYEIEERQAYTDTDTSRYRTRRRLVDDPRDLERRRLVDDRRDLDRIRLVDDRRDLDRRRQVDDHVDLDGIRRRVVNEDRHFALRGERIYREQPVIYDREVFASAVEPLSRGRLLPEPALSYAYERNLEMDSYRRDPLVQHRELQTMGSELRRRGEIDNHDIYTSFREPNLHGDVYSRGLPPDYHAPAGLHPTRRLGGHLAEQPSSVASIPEYRVALPYRY